MRGCTTSFLVSKLRSPTSELQAGNPVRLNSQDALTAVLKLQESKHSYLSCALLSSSVAESNLQILNYSTLQVPFTMHTQSLTRFPTRLPPPYKSTCARCSAQTQAGKQQRRQHCLTFLEGRLINILKLNTTAWLWAWQQESFGYLKEKYLESNNSYLKW